MTDFGQRIRLTILLLLLGYCSSCGGSSDEEAYNPSLHANSSNLNMQGEPLRAKSPEEIAQMQDNLQRLGYDPGPVDGTYGLKTKLAIRRFQAEHGILSDGAAGSLTESAIRRAIYAREALQESAPRSSESPKQSTP